MSTTQPLRLVECLLLAALFALAGAASDLTVSLASPAGALAESGRLVQLLLLETGVLAALLAPLLVLVSRGMAHQGQGVWRQRGAVWGLSLALIFALVVSTQQGLPRMGWALTGGVMLQLAAFFFAAAWGALLLAVLLGRLLPKSASLGAALALPAALALVSCGCLAAFQSKVFARDVPSAGRGKPNGARHIILLTVDTLRPDFLRVYNPDAPPTPALSRFAQDAVVYDNAMTLSPWTKPSLATMLTGLPPDQHGVKGPFDALSDDFTTVPEALLASGYRTGLIGFNPYFDPSSQVDQGFEEYRGFPRGGLGTSFAAELVGHFGLPIEDDPGDTPGMTALAQRWIRAHKDEPFFLWMHYYDPHQPYQPPDKYMPEGEPPSEELRHFREFKKVRGGYARLTAEERDWIRALYAGEVRQADENVGMLLDEMKSLGIYDDAMIVFASDHGEEFWEHGGFEHGHALYEEVMRVPMMVKLPGNAKKGKRVQRRVSLMSIHPTLLAGAHVEAEDGLKREPPLTEPAQVAQHERPFVGQALLYYEDKLSFTKPPHKYIRSLVTGKEEVYDLAMDPDEKHSLTATAPDLRARLSDSLDDRMDLRDDGERHEAAAPSKVDPAMLENLRALGYAE